MNLISPLALVYVAYCVALPAALWLPLAEPPGKWEMVAVQVSVFVALIGGGIEFRVTQSTKALLAFLLAAVLSGIVTHALYYMQLDLMRTFSWTVHEPSFSDALYFSIVTFTTLGYGDLAPREEYRLVAAFQAIYGYVFLGIFVGTLVKIFSGAIRTPHR